MTAMERAEKFLKENSDLFSRHMPRELITAKLGILILQAERDQVKEDRLIFTKITRGKK